MAAIALIALLPGCSLFENPLPLKQTAKKLPTLKLPPDAVQLEIVFVERPLGDALLGDDLWQQVDQVASFDRDTRAALRQNGFRVGLVGSHPPDALQTLLGLKAGFAYEPVAEKSKQLVGRKFIVRSGWTTEVQVSPYFEECKAVVKIGDQSRPRQFSNARCLYHVTLERVQDGWVRLDFVPRIKHGAERASFSATDGDWLPTTSQKSENFYPQRFSLNLSMGEMAILSADENSVDSLGRLFFIGPGFGGQDAETLEKPVSIDDGNAVQRLLVVRLADVQ